jgi:hypothetical protein
MANKMVQHTPQIHVSTPHTAHSIPTKAAHKAEKSLNRHASSLRLLREARNQRNGSAPEQQSPLDAAEMIKRAAEVELTDYMMEPLSMNIDATFQDVLSYWQVRSILSLKTLSLTSI